MRRVFIALSVFGQGSVEVFEAAIPVTANVRATFSQTPQSAFTQVLEDAGSGRSGFLSDAARGKGYRLSCPTRTAVLKSTQRAPACNPRRRVKLEAPYRCHAAFIVFRAMSIIS